MRVRLDGGASTVEWGAVILLIAGIVGALVLSPLPSEVGGGLRSAICKVNQSGDCDQGPVSTTGQPGTGGAQAPGGPGGQGQPPGQPTGPAGQPTGQPTGPAGQPGAGGETPEQLQQAIEDAEEEAAEADEEARQADTEADRQDKEAGGAGDIAAEAIKEATGIGDAERCLDGDAASCGWTALTFVPFLGWAGRAAKAGKAMQRAKKLKKAYDTAKGAATAARRRAAQARGKAAAARERARQARERFRQKCGVEPNSFVAGTPVLLGGGRYRPIEDVDIGDAVWAADPLTRRAGVRTVTHLITGQGVKRLVDITIDVDGAAGGRTATLTATGGHPFWNAGDHAWVEAGGLSAGDELATPGGGRVTVVTAKAYVREQRVYNLAIAGLHTYHVAAGGTAVLVHNSQPGQPGCTPKAPGTRAQLRGAGTHGLPGGGNSSGPFRFRPASGESLKKVGPGKYEDRFGNVWQEGPAHGRAASDGFAKEWDVQLSPKGEKAWGQYAKKGKGGKPYVNVTPDGNLSH